MLTGFTPIWPELVGMMAFSAPEGLLTGVIVVEVGIESPLNPLLPDIPGFSPADDGVGLGDPFLA